MSMQGRLAGKQWCGARGLGREQHCGSDKTLWIDEDAEGLST